ncbi:MAG TPA: hypothetical protein VG204_12345 [Terriglobia bacterium]|nr:hypothetical protein [Terriglobia bacterium]
MTRKLHALQSSAVITGAIVLAGVSIPFGSGLYAKHKAEEAVPDDATAQLFQLLDSSRDGKLADFYLLADVYKDASKPDDEYRHVLRLDYDKSRGFGKLNLWVRSVGKMTPQQLQTYTPKQIYDFAETDLEKYVKTTASAFGGSGDLYLRADGDGPLATSSITDDVRKSYDVFVTQYVLPALQKK